jgi:amidophosphoribosyltransferase
MISEKKESCGLFGIYGDSDAVQKTYFGLHSLQHRGQESAGIASSDGENIQCYTGMGTVRRVFRAGRSVFDKLPGNIAIGHVRYSTTGSSRVENSQPFFVGYSQGQVAVAHNGNLINATRLRDEYEAYGSIFKSTADTEVICHLLAKPTHVRRSDPLAHVLNHLQGAYSLLFLFADRIEAVRDPYGIRPLCIGQTEEGCYVAASETCALDAVGAKLVREVEPGEIVRLDENGISSRFFVKPGDITPAHCIFEHVYFAKQNSTIFHENVHHFRKKLGGQLAREHPADADVVIPVPDSGTSAAIGYAERSGIPFDMGMVRSHYVGRTFISPDQKLRELEVKLKLAVVNEVVAGKRVVVVDDSIVRGTTTRGKIRALRLAGAKEIHMRVSCPPIRFPCFYGIDFPTKEELLANNRDLEQIREFLEVDSVGYI